MAYPGWCFGTSSYFGLLILVTLLMFWFYWKEIVRSRSLQAFFASMTLLVENTAYELKITGRVPPRVELNS